MTISDGQLVAVLRPFVRACGPVLDSLRDADPFGLRARADTDLAGVESGLKAKLLNGVTSVKVPGTDAWAQMTGYDRSSWWMNRVGRFTALLTAVPGLGGALADRVPVQDTVGAASQGLLLCAIAGEYGVTDVGTRVRLIASVLFGRDIPPGLAAGHDEAAEAVAADRLTEDLAASERKHGKATVNAAAGTLWRLGRSLGEITGELGKRPRGRMLQRAIGKVPVVGVAGNYLSEGSGLREAWQRAHGWLTEHAPPATAPR
ncbi:hypothetical protein Q5425_32650 [Amycolatopsis sp. A133]|uniref:hypothetical protein n=1 Tax=Amycolatopsis sp. A133 TaxID=3064472 RepID=UPI0027FF0FAF|nr:hypothetical protein [Amycolatopsis sp. A133]MDQ7808510.1 hypothetical protein [Amycolatopsis sp. A133]